MTRPALIIGLGGTGQWVLTHLKKNLLETYRGEIPPTIQLLAFDMHERITQREAEEHHLSRVTIGGVSLANEEYVCFQTDLDDFVDEIIGGKHQCFSWFNTERYRRLTIDEPTYGDQGPYVPFPPSRQFSRLSFIKKLRSGRQSKIILSLSAAVQKIVDSIGDNGKTYDFQNWLDTYIIGSLAGRTGAGLLVDMPLVCREIAQNTFGDYSLVRGFLVSPRAFYRGTNRNMFARSFAAWRELDRMLVTNGLYGANQVCYSDHDPELRLEIKRRLYDETFIVEPNRKDYPLEKSPEQDLFPGLAQAIQALINDPGVYHHRTSMLSGVFPEIMSKPTHAAIGSYSLKKPVFDIFRKKSFLLAKDVLEVLLGLEPEEDTGQMELANSTSQDRLGYQIKNFFSSDAFNSQKGEEKNSSLLKMIARINDLNREDSEGLKQMSQDISQGGVARMGSELLEAWIDFDQGEDTEEAARRVEEEVLFQLWDQIQTSKEYGDTPGEAFHRIQQKAKEVRLSHVGKLEGSGQFEGSFQSALRTVQRVQVDRFAHALSLYSERILNGTNDNAVQAKAGKIGQLKTFCDQLDKALLNFSEFISEVQKQRQLEYSVLEKAAEETAQALDAYRAVKDNNCWITFWDRNIHPRAYQAQREYLEAAQRELNVIKDDILLDYYQKAVADMITIVEYTREDIESWLLHLAGAPDKDEHPRSPGLYQALLQRLEGIDEGISLDQSMEKIVRLVGDEVEYQASRDLIGEVLDHVSWEVSVDHDPLRASSPEEPSRPRGLKISLLVEQPEKRHLNNYAQDAREVNLEIFRKLTSGFFEKLLNEQDIHKCLLKDFEDGAQLAEAFDKRAEPYVRYHDDAGGPQHRPGSIGVIHHPELNSQETAKIVEQFSNEMKREQSGVRFSPQNSRDQNRITLVRLDQIIPSQDFQSWHQCRQAYLDLIKDNSIYLEPRDMHIFPEEINACQYEKLIRQTVDEEFDLLGPLVVALLGSDQRMEMFFRALALGLITSEKDDNGDTYWKYENKLGEKILLFRPEWNRSEKLPLLWVLNQFLIKERGIHSEEEGEVRIDFESLNDRIWDERDRLGEEAIKQKYLDEMEREGGLIRELEDTLNQARAQESKPDIQKWIASDVESLLYLGKAILTRAARMGI